ncbi:MAG: hypothetical protein MJ241_02740 [Bacilli bacterium]|nr:hypothetical protein [Bacilli bacterium]
MIFASNWNFSLENYFVVWSVLFQVGILLLSMLIAHILRSVIPFLKKSLIPSALIGGVIILIIEIILNATGAKLFGQPVIQQDIMQVITYHGLGIGFVAMTLKVNEKKEKGRLFAGIQNGFLTGGTYMLQAVLGLAVTIVAYYITQNASNTIFYSSGAILPLAFGQGPGNALAWDVNFSADYSSMFSTNGSFGLSLASIGFIVASLVGVAYINIQKARGKIAVTENKSDTYNTVIHEENTIEESDSVDKFTIQVGLVALGYGLAFAFMCGLGAISDFTNSIAWGFNFLWGVLFAMLIKLVYNLLRKKNVLKKNCISNYQMDRISGFAFDLMIVAGVASIDIGQIANYVWIIVILSVLGTIGTYVYCRLISKICFKGYEHHVFAMNFGALTGTASNGMILLKEIDPNLETPTSSIYIISQVPATLCVAPLLLLMNFTGKSVTNALISLGIFTVLFIGYTVFLVLSPKMANRGASRG